MRSTLVTLLFAFSPSLFAKQVELTCFRRSYSCLLPRIGCQWKVDKTAVPSLVDLAKDPMFPNAQYPFELWIGEAFLDNGNYALRLEVIWSDQDVLHPVKVNATLSAGQRVAETSGLETIDIALRSDSQGGGFNCTNFRVVE